MYESEQPHHDHVGSDHQKPTRTMTQLPAPTAFVSEMTGQIASQFKEDPDKFRPKIRDPDPVERTGPEPVFVDSSSDDGDCVRLATDSSDGS